MQRCALLMPEPCKPASSCRTRGRGYKNDGTAVFGRSHKKRSAFLTYLRDDLGMDRDAIARVRGGLGRDHLLCPLAGGARSPGSHDRCQPSSCFEPTHKKKLAVF